MRNMNMLCAHIEHLWDQLGRAVHMRLHAQSTLADLSRFVVEEWDRLPENSVHRLVNSMRRRCELLIAAAGGPTRY